MSINWAKHAHWFEAEGTKRSPEGYPTPLETITQDVSRSDIVKTLCGELKLAGFTPRIYTSDKMTRCRLYRVEEAKRFIERIRTHFISEQTKTWAEEYLNEIKKREERRILRGGRPRIPFKQHKKFYKIV